MSFYQEISKYYKHIFPYNPKQKEFIINKSNKSSQSVLEVGCGLGDLIFELENNFNLVSGFDLDSEMVKHALNRKKVNNSKVQINELNMLDISKQFSNNSFDTIFSFGNTIVHLNKDDINSFLKSSYSVLKNNGKLLIQIINYDRIIDQNIDFLPTIDNKYINFKRTYKLKNNSIQFKTKLTTKGNDKIFSNEISLYPIRQTDILNLLKQNNFKNIKCYGGFDQSTFKIDKSIPLIISADKLV